jgi:regulator of PEP synthase PpsR (kinase-PPPase family)
MRRTVLFISDGTAITAETFGQSLLTQFKGHDFRRIRLPFVDTVAKAQETVDLIHRTAEADGAAPLVFSTIVDTAVGSVLHGARAEVFDMFGTFIRTPSARPTASSTPTATKTGWRPPITP